jgi:lysosomal acid lipase/cholesteryl ester hydrolase
VRGVVLAVGTGALLTSASFWRRIWTRAFYARVIDVCTSQLFAWSMENMGSVSRREELYAHLFAFSSVKTIVHWFQIVASNRFQMYDENQNFSKGYQDISPIVSIVLL